jgi:hypothetical protein
MMFCRVLKAVVVGKLRALSHNWEITMNWIQNASSAE